MDAIYILPSELMNRMSLTRLSIAVVQLRRERNYLPVMLTASGNKLFYHTFPDNNRHFYEIDFLLSRAQKICPIEVKSSGYKAHKSLDLFCGKYSDRIGNRYLMYTKDFGKDKQVLMVPVYMTSML